MRRICFVVTGRVQGVAFRAHAVAEGRRLGLSGFVQNRRDGAVEGEAQGPPEAVAAFLQWLQRGSPAARVEQVDLAEMPVRENDAHFAVRR